MREDKPVHGHVCEVSFEQYCSIVDDVEFELAVGSSVPSLAVGLRLEISILDSLDIPGVLYCLRCFAPLHTRRKKAAIAAK